MNTHVDITPPRAVANRAEERVATLPQTLLAGLLDLCLSDADAETAKPDLTRIDAALAFLDTEFLPTFSESVDASSEGVETACQKLTEALHTLRHELEDHASADDKAALKAIAKRIDTRIVPAITAFFSVVFETVATYEATNSIALNSVDNTALTNISMISRKINFIAVNASVEAARVGDVGRGFAVIATEIRELSLQAAQAVEKLKNQLS